MKLILFLFRLLIFLWAIYCFHGCIKTNTDDSNNTGNEILSGTPVGTPTGDLVTKTFIIPGQKIYEMDNGLEFDRLILIK